MAKLTKLRIRQSGARTELIVLVRHPMETGQQRGDEAQWSVPADYIDKMIFELNGAVVAEARLGPGISSDPLTGIALKKAKVGDRVTVSWVDNRGERGIAETIIT